ncbi:hypothetical protein [Streptomyces sp. SID12501]|uniref:Lipoprotein n=1 Tax=Streptomyces sp. SID12501 TaxID=2706042 RepID=A0A6B3BGE3_9ACTN|nr:hypothetical protein [Streptomyces sp. SID12501]NEC84850.1 hypothetical protein [Streptomyces sp. SID12501]
MKNRHLRKAILTSAAITVGLLMTACQNGTADSSSDKSSASPVATTDNASDSKDSSPGTDSSSSPGTEPDSDSDSSPGTEDDSDSRETVVEGINEGKGVNGTWFGTVSYVAPSKYSVSDSKGTEQQFFVAEDTKIIGYDDICDAVNTGPGGEGGVECTEDQLEAAAKKGLSAQVEISNGIATTITDDN